MASLFHPAAERIAATGSGTMMGGPARAIAHTTEGSTIEGAVAEYKKENHFPTFTVDCNRGRIAQHYPANVSARALENTSRGLETNRMGSVCIQVEFIGFAAQPFTAQLTNTGRATLESIIAFCEEHGVPRVWPRGQPLAFGVDERRPGVVPAAFGVQNGQRDMTTWTTLPGWYSHSQVPENHHGDPGRIDLTLWEGDMPLTAQDLDLISSRVREQVLDIVRKEGISGAAGSPALARLRMKVDDLTAANAAATVDADALAAALASNAALLAAIAKAVRDNP